MTDPYRPASRRGTLPDLVSTGEVRSPLEQFTARLHDLGATPDEIAQVADYWDAFDEDWTPEVRAQVQAADDDQLRAMLQGVRDEYDVGTTTQEDADAAERARQLQAAVAEAEGRIGGNVESLRAWVGDDPARAEAVLRLELAPEGAGRSTLVGPLATQLGLDTGDLEALRALYAPQAAPQAPRADPEGLAPPEATRVQDGAAGPESGQPGDA